jgi:lipoyl(octanoyl) transferase
MIEQVISRASLQTEDWGLIDYSLAFERQNALVEQVYKGESPETLVFCSHPPVVTLGRATREGDVFGWRGSTVEVNRGGRATYHGPNQLVAYPILDLSSRGRDLHLYMRQLEDAMIATLTEFGIHSAGRSMQTQVGDSGLIEATGVWIGTRKIASIGIGVRHWISFHGLALNVHHDPSAFQGMNPCGFTTSTMTSMEEVAGRKFLISEVRDTLQRELRSILDSIS